MPPVNPNALSDAEYRAMVNAAMQPDSPGEMLFRQMGEPAPMPRGIAGISRGGAYWGGAPQGWLADIASRGGMAVQQNGYDTTAAVPVAAGPAWAGPSPVPAYPQSGAHMTMPGSREAWHGWGVPPVMMQSSPYATAAYRTYTDPYGQIGVQPLIGFPSAYPHVLSGVPNNPFRVQGFINALLPQAGFMPFMGMPQMRGGTATPPNTRGNNRNTTTKNNANTPPATNPPFIGWARPNLAPAAETRGYVSPENQAWLGSLNREQAAAQAQTAGTPWYAPIIDDFARIGIRFPMIDYQPPNNIGGATGPQTPSTPVSPNNSSMFQFTGSDWDRAMQHLNPQAPLAEPVVPTPAGPTTDPSVFLPPETTAVPVQSVPIPDSVALLPSILQGYYG